MTPLKVQKKHSKIVLQKTLSVEIPKKNWKVVERKAEYENVFANERKQYFIKEL